MDILKKFGISISLASFITLSYLFFNMDYTLMPIKLYKNNIDAVIIDFIPEKAKKIIVKSIKDSLDTIEEQEEYYESDSELSYTDI